MTSLFLLGADVSADWPTWLYSRVFPNPADPKDRDKWPTIENGRLRISVNYAWPSENRSSLAKRTDLDRLTAARSFAAAHGLVL